MPRKNAKLTPVPQASWRTALYAELNRDLADVVGDTTAAAFAGIRVRTVGDLLRLVPRRYIAGTETSNLGDLVEGEEVAVVARVASVRVRGQEPRMRLEAVITDGDHYLDVTFFGKGYLVKYWERTLATGVRGIFVGKVGWFNDRPQLSHPNYIVLDPDGGVARREAGHGSSRSGAPLSDRAQKAAAKQAEREVMARQLSTDGFVGLYPARAGLPTWTIAETVELVLQHVGTLAEPLPEWVVLDGGWPSLDRAVHDVHEPSSLDEAARGIERLQFDEVLALQLTMARRRQHALHEVAPVLSGRSGGLLDQFDAGLPFSLTAGQQAVSGEVFSDIALNHPMQRLLQGEVGSGKTLVALRAMLRAVDSGQQAVLVAPTEVLAAQHAQTIRALLGPLGAGRVLGGPEDATGVVLLTGSMSAPSTRRALLDIASGEAGIIVGTHALFGQRVQFAGLGLVVLDEQHRFGVEQRAALLESGALRPHQLVMTATPIPRTIAMTVFGDLEVSTLTEIPSGRSEVQTTVVATTRNPAWVDRCWQRIREEVAAGRQAFIVCPRIGDDAGPSDDEAGIAGDGAAASRGSAERQPSREPGDSEPTRPMASALETHQMLAAGPLSGLRLGLLHGRLPADEKDATMAAFAAGELDVLVSTTVIEVGVDVPNASVMVVLDADRFGVSQLHQLRGRIGRGRHPGLCLLVTAAAPDTPALTRVTAVAATRDGFALADLDLAQRREGDVLGSSQAGTQSSLRLTRVADSPELIRHARDIAARLVADDPDERDDHLADMVTQTELQSAAVWMERS